MICNSLKPKNCQVLLCVLIYDNMYSTVMKVAEDKLDFELTKDTPYLALIGERWGVCCKYLGTGFTMIREELHPGEC